MKNLYFLLLLTCCSTTAFAKSYYTNLIPNGGKFSCQTCHVFSTGGSPWNSFGNDAMINTNNFGEPDWAKLFELDSDGDGFTNGEELQDPTGDWRSGSPNPGNPLLVTNPGDGSSFPTSVERNWAEYMELVNLGSNPSYSNFSFELTNKLMLPATINIHDLNGSVIKEFSVGSTANIRIDWDGKDSDNDNVPNGVYFLRTQVGKAVLIEKLILNRN